MTIGHGRGGSQEDRGTEILHIQQLIAISATAQHGEVFSVFGPIVEQRKDTKPLRPDERFGANDGNTHAPVSELPADLFGLDLGLAVGAHPVQAVVFLEGMVIGDAVDGRGRDMDQPVYA